MKRRQSKLYLVSERAFVYRIVCVMANSQEQARLIANNADDTCFVEIEESPDWKFEYAKRIHDPPDELPIIA